MNKNLCIRKLDCKAKLFFLLALVLLIPDGLSFAATEMNKMVSIQMESFQGSPVLRIVTEKPIADFAHTAYPLGDLSRVVIALPRMDARTISSLMDMVQPPVQKLEVLTGSTALGSMSWVEVLLSKGVEYDVAIHHNELVLTLLESEEQKKAEEVATVLKIDEPVAVSISGSPEETNRASVDVSAPVKKALTPASQIMRVALGPKAVALQADGFVDNFKFFSLDEPERLVVDVYGIAPGFEERTVTLSDEFSKMRVGVHQEKLRFVFDSSGKLPQYAVARKEGSLEISWGDGISSLPAPIPEPPKERKPALVVIPAPVNEVKEPARKIMDFDLGPRFVALQADGRVENYKFFNIDGPDRLVVDVYGVSPGFKARSVHLSGGFRSMRVGVHQEKLRFVLDSSSKLPKYAVTREGDRLLIRWGAVPLPITAPISRLSEETKRVKIAVDAPKKKERLRAFSKEYLNGKTLYVVSFVEDDSGINNAVVAKEVFNADGTVDITYLSNQYEKTTTYGVTKAGLLFYGSNVADGNTINCSTEHYINTDYTISGVFDSVDIYFFEKERAVDFANTLFNSIPQGCL